jgi:hypothetical protein
MANREFPLIQGEVGLVLTFWLSYEDDDGDEQLYDLTGKDVYLRAWREDPQGRTINDAVCVPDPDQVVNKGKGTYTFDSTTANIAADSHRFRFRVVNGVDERFFPKDTDPDAHYGVLQVSPAN